MDREETDEMTRVAEVDKLVADPGFLRYHAEYVKRRQFNAFDVLRYSEEIRHSNVMAWLLDPAGTHGIGRRFLEWFLERARLPGKLPPESRRADGAGGAGVVLRGRGDLPGERSGSAHCRDREQAVAGFADQVRGQEERLRSKYPGRPIHSVLLSTSQEGIAGEDGIAHVSWRDVGAQIKAIHDKGDFGQGEVAPFIRQYLVAVGRMIGPEDSDADYFRKLPITTPC